jgi:hypothetical protein
MVILGAFPAQHWEVEMNSSTRPEVPDWDARDCKQVRVIIPGKWSK